LEAFGKALQNMSAHNKKKCRDFNAKVVHYNSEYYMGQNVTRKVESTMVAPSRKDNFVDYVALVPVMLL
jgi:hypothetical protein